jgi:hypothetical protein
MKNEKLQMRALETVPSSGPPKAAKSGSSADQPAYNRMEKGWRRPAKAPGPG